ncbi:uncharacterized protein TEOVI_000838700 [Trypanosoma equiperdum]|uniref:Uncharacterized protein n=1 Tax=Trypanosoma equiperdum TaxID=5694 RepID=A0A1G4I6Q5_TRYEQ|nr:hypothetical protein, conserved [Trypanosoma equiperdum]
MLQVTENATPDQSKSSMETLKGSRDILSDFVPSLNDDERTAEDMRQQLGKLGIISTAQPEQLRDEQQKQLQDIRVEFANQMKQLQRQNRRYLELLLDMLERGVNR